jgi:glutathione S-transferase
VLVPGSKLPRLITIPISHFCEKARWALDRTGIPYREERHVQLVHRLYVRRAGGGTTAPVLVTADGVFTESRDIVAWADRRLDPADRLIPEDADARADVERLVTEFDDDLGPHGRRWIYWHVLPNRRVGVEYNCTGVPAWERRAFPVLLPLSAIAIRRLLEITPETVAASEDAVWASFDRVAGRLADGRRFLVGDRFSAADLTFAALAASVVLPEEYGVPLPQPEALHEPLASGVRRFREHPAGAFALELFRTERRFVGRARAGAAYC